MHANVHQHLALMPGATIVTRSSQLSTKNDFRPSSILSCSLWARIVAHKSAVRPLVCPDISREAATAVARLGIALVVCSAPPALGGDGADAGRGPRDSSTSEPFAATESPLLSPAAVDFGRAELFVLNFLRVLIFGICVCLKS